MQGLYQLTMNVFGIVQGVGFRPFTAREAKTFLVSGYVKNRGAFVEILAEGKEGAVRQFASAIEMKAPERAVILRVDKKIVPIQERQYASFTIEVSQKESGDAFISPDIAICDTCAHELFDKKNRRYLHPFINCTQCGPRLTIMEGLPYDRERTSMKKFPMCPKCEKEYTDPTSRRYDAQPVCCPDCGPSVFLLSDPQVRGAAAITRIRRLIMDGGIAAIKGIGGFHLACDARNEEAVRKLRERKARLHKPFAVMMKDEETAEREVLISPAQRKVLCGHQKPIVLLERKADSSRSQVAPLVAPSVAPGNPFLGVMLPYAPVQLLLFTYPDDVKMSDCLVMTSANDSGAPICRTDEDARRELMGIADLILTNDRPILIRADDSVVDFYQNEPYMVRRSRGYAPLPYPVKGLAGTVLGVGGELKNAFTIGKNGLFYPSSYVGDLSDERTVQALRDSCGRMEQLLEAKVQIVACDLHPRYASAAFAAEKAKELGVPLLKVQHHYAHVLSCMAENGVSDKTLGIVFDGTGYGTDGSIWGGELLLTDYSGFTREGSIQSFQLPGADLAAREGWRCAVSLILDLTGDLSQADVISQELDLAEPFAVRVLSGMKKQGVNTSLTTSVGRLFDAVSAVLGIKKTSTFEGEAAQALEFAALRYEKRTGLEERKAELGRFLKEIGQESDVDFRETEQGRSERFSKGLEQENRSTGPSQGKEGSLHENAPVCHIRTDLLFARILKERLESLHVQEQTQGERTGQDEQEKQLPPEQAERMRKQAERLAWDFHAALARLTAGMAQSIAQRTGVMTAALTGGSFQNTLLLRLTQHELEDRNIKVIRHHLLPPNDGGISLGQAVAAAFAISKRT